MGRQVKVAVVPHDIDPVRDAIVQGGGVAADAGDADALVWTDPSDPESLRSILSSSPARWVQLPFAGIERFFDAGVIDPALIWTCAKGIYGPACAEQAVALVLAGARQLQRHARRSGWWSNRDGAILHRRLRGTTALVVGTGGIGRAFAPMIAPFGVRIIAVNRSGEPMRGADMTVPAGQLTDVIGEADNIVIAAALTPDTYRMIDARMLSLMRPDAWLVNVARGGLVDTDALVEALHEEKIGGAALDVTDPEPVPDDHPLWSLPNAIITSHTANTWAMAIPELCDLVGRNVQHFAAGERLEGLVDPALGY